MKGKTNVALTCAVRRQPSFCQLLPLIRRPIHKMVSHIDKPKPPKHYALKNGEDYQEFKPSTYQYTFRGSDGPTRAQIYVDTVRFSSSWSRHGESLFMIVFYGIALPHQNFNAPRVPRQALPSIQPSGAAIARRRLLNPLPELFHEDHVEIVV